MFTHNELDNINKKHKETTRNMKKQQGTSARNCIFTYSQLDNINKKHEITFRNINNFKPRKIQKIDLNVR